MKKPSFQLSSKTILALGSITLFGFSFLSFLIIYILAPKESFIELITSGAPLFQQTFVGLAFGGASYLTIQFFLKRELFPTMFDHILVFSKQLNWAQIVFISIAAGVGEELLFRVSIQYFLGIWATAIVFVMIHGYYSFKNPYVFLYGLLMTFISGGFGYIYLNYGIVSSIIAHFLIDLLILSVLKLHQPK